MKGGDWRRRREEVGGGEEEVRRRSLEGIVLCWGGVFEGEERREGGEREERGRWMNEKTKNVWCLAVSKRAGGGWGKKETGRRLVWLMERRVREFERK